MHVSPSVPLNEFHKWMMQNIEAEAVLEPKQTREFQIDAKPGHHHVSAFAFHALAFLVAGDTGPSEVNLELFDGQLLPDQMQVKTGPIRVRIHNNIDSRVGILAGFLGGDQETHPAPSFVIRAFLTGKRVLTSQTFRRLFKAEAIEVGTGLQVKNLTVLFTDLQASTLMYERVGDLKALDIVRRHFEVLEAVVAKHRGAVVKTIGDAVMAVFAEADQAMLSAAEMIDNVRRAVAHGEDLVLKIGLHCGSCVAIQSNNQMDYFGRTVNIAARVQALADGGEIVCTDEIWGQPGVEDVVRSRGLSVKREQPLLKGIADRFPVRRIVVANVVPLPTARRKAKAAAVARKPAARSKAKARAKTSRVARPKARRSAGAVRRRA